MITGIWSSLHIHSKTSQASYETSINNLLQFFHQVSRTNTSAYSSPGQVSLLKGFNSYHLFIFFQLIMVYLHLYSVLLWLFQLFTASKIQGFALLSLTKVQRLDSALGMSPKALSDLGKKCQSLSCINEILTVQQLVDLSVTIQIF